MGVGKVDRGMGIDPILLGATQAVLPELDVRVTPSPEKEEARLLEIEERQVSQTFRSTAGHPN